MLQNYATEWAADEDSRTLPLDSVDSITAHAHALDVRWAHLTDSTSIIDKVVSAAGVVQYYAPSMLDPDAATATLLMSLRLHTSAAAGPFSSLLLPFCSSCRFFWQ
jgi:hypothetical protein